MKIVARLLIVLCLLGAAPAQAPCPTMQLAATAVQASASTRDVVSTDGRVMHVARQPLLAFNDFTNASVTLTEGQISLNVGLTPSGSKRWADFTVNNVGVTVAFMVGDKVVMAPRIKDPNSASGFMVGPMERAEAQKLADSINRKCVPAATDGR